MYWTEITAAEAKERHLILPKEGIVGPVNEFGELCPWPWDPELLLGAPIGMYHCPYCGTMCVAGVPHPDYADDRPE